MVGFRRDRIRFWEKQVAHTVFTQRVSVMPMAVTKLTAAAPECSAAGKWIASHVQTSEQGKLSPRGGGNRIYISLSLLPGGEWTC